MYRLNSIIWISAGIIVGWFISRMVSAEHRRAEQVISKDDESE